MEKPLIIIILGPPGSGKGTQAKLLAKKFNLEYIGCGDNLRQRQELNDFTGKKIFKTVNKGKLAPSFIVVKILGDILEKIKKRSRIKGFVLDGWTRIIFEAIFVDEALDWYEWDKRVKIFFINISKKESLKRLSKRRQCKKCGQIIPWLGQFKKLKVCNKCKGKLIVRGDDNINSIKKRFEEYGKQTKKTINYYKRQERLSKINGQQSIEKVFQEILEKLET